MSVELGTWLKQCRLDRGMSLEELEAITKIRKRYLIAIEEGDYSVLPGSFYVRAFIKSYAEAVGLDPNETLKYYKNVLPQTTADSAVEPPRRRRSYGRQTEKIGLVASTVLMVSFIVLIVGIAYYFIMSNQEPKEAVDNDPITSQGVPPQDATPTPSAAAPAVSATPTPTPSPVATVVKQATSGKTDHYAVSGTRKISLTLKVTGDECWVRVAKVNPDGSIKQFEQGIFKNGEIKEWEFDTSVNIVVGKAVAIELAAEGVVLDTGKSSGRKEIQLNLLPPGATPTPNAGA
ncbi:helix-turn-helix domain-containing protein [Paenibacillus thermoaerophilus]|uniref:Helix-turn-helix domain-containing protein n=1 Tax=Paenibacillus thermoaerophilus TaxID=1215385 RepID=A0ABW2V4T3_9BACL|nr:helix-turn-helix domain-containing protein [Paenibacillus thermoaerophilus]TMV13860.1 helix-turn-helix domain-containing protein [Paenibacillus thermoaerophilus]